LKHPKQATCILDQKANVAKPIPAEASTDHQIISRDELRARLQDRSLTLLDVLPKESYANAHIPGAINLPVAEIEDTARRLVPNLTREIVVYCNGPT